MGRSYAQLWIGPPFDCYKLNDEKLLVKRLIFVHFTTSIIRHNTSIWETIGVLLKLF